MISTKNIKWKPTKNNIILKDEKAITLVALIITIIILLLLAGISIMTLKNVGLIENAKKAKEESENSEIIENNTIVEYEAKIGKYINNSKEEDYISKDIEDFTPTIKESNGTYIYATAENIKVNNGVKIGAYVWILNGKVVGGTTENAFLFDNLNHSSKYNLQAMAVDENGKFKISNMISANTMDKTYLYLKGKVFEVITGGISHVNRTAHGGCSATFNSDNIYIDAYSNGGGGGVTTNKSIDLTEFNTIKFRGKVTQYYSDDSGGRILATSTSNSWGSSWLPSNSNNVYSKKDESKNPLELDISSLNGKYYIINGFNQSRGYIYEIWLE